jgi:hypothetical protein
MVNRKYPDSGPRIQVPTLSVDELLDRLRRADRRGRLDDVRRIEAVLARSGHAVATFELAASANGGGQ